jgi:glycosyltransferase involved in cell wall biosynthesis
MSRPRQQHPELVCLLPAHNCKEDLPGFFASIDGLVDSVVALDDGSTDRTHELLEAEPMVTVLLTNPPRQGYRSWDDAANRNRLLRAASELEPRWILSLDADERIAPDDREALARLISHEADPTCAYLLSVFALAEDAATEDTATFYDGPRRWVGRLFAFQSGQVFPSQRLHSVPIPTSIPRSRWRKTTVRIQHLAYTTEARRLRRYQKYQEVDPMCAYQASYEHLLVPRGPIRPWPQRPPRLPVLLNGADRQPTLAQDGDPVLSAIVISRDDGALIERAVASVVAQECPAPFEVIVVTSGAGEASAIVRERFPHVRLVELDHPALPGEARNAGLRIARGTYVSFPGSHVELGPGSLAARVRAHELGYAMVTGTMLNGTTTLAGWASYFLDNASVLPGRPSGPLPRAPIRCSYLREALGAIGLFPEDMRAGEDTVVNLSLFSMGYGAYRSREITLYHHSRCRTARRLVTHHFARGRAFGRILLDSAVNEGNWRRLARFVFGGPFIRVRQVRRDTHAWGPEFIGRFRAAFPLFFVAATSAWAGWCYELLVRSAMELRSGGSAKSTDPPPIPANCRRAAWRSSARSRSRSSSSG